MRQPPIALSASLNDGKPPNISSSPATRAKRLLVAWSDSPVRETLTTTLRSAGFEVDVVDCELVFQTVRKFRPDAIILEVAKGTIQTGAKMVKDLRQHMEFIHLPIYVCASCPSLPAWNRARGPNVGPTRLFNTLLSPLAEIAREVTEELTSGATAESAQTGQSSETLTSASGAAESDGQGNDELFSLFVKTAARNSVADSNRSESTSKDPGPMEQTSRKTRRTTPAAALPEPPELSALNLLTDASAPSATPGTSDTPGSEAPSRRPSFAMFVIRNGGEIHFAYPSGVAMFKGESDELAGQNLATLIEGGLDAELQQIFQSSESSNPNGERVSVEVMARSRDGATFPAVLTLTRVADGSESCWTAVFKDKSSATDPGALEDLQEQLQSLSGQMVDYPVTLKQCEEARWALEQANERNRSLQEELAGLRGLCDELLGKFSDDPATPGRAKKELEVRLGESTAELERMKADLEKQSAERNRWETEFKRLSESNKALENELAQFRESGAGSETNRPNRGAATLARVNTELEKERGERRRIEQRSASLAVQMRELHRQLGQQLESEHAAQETSSQLQVQVGQQQEMLSRMQSELDKQTAHRQMIEQQLRTSGDLSAQLRNCISSFETAKKAFKRTQDELEARLQATQGSLKEAEARCQKELSERQRLEEALAAAQSATHQHAQNEIELTKLRCALDIEQAERKRLEGDAVQSRYASMDSARAGLNRLQEVRGQLRQPTDAILQSTRALLESAKEEDRKLIEFLLENALLLQTTLQESERSDSSLAETPSSPPPAAPPTS